MAVRGPRMFTGRRPVGRRKLAGGVLAAAVAVGACSGSGESLDDTDVQGAAEPAADAVSDDWAHERDRCDGLRAQGTITNTSGEPAAFAITYSFASSDPSSGPGFESERTPVLADGQSHGYRISPSSVTEAPGDCTFVGIVRVELSDDELAEGSEAQEAAPGELLDAGQVEPVWDAAVGGRLLGARVADGRFFARIVDPEGHTIVRGDLSTGTIDWAVPVDQRIETFTPDGRGGVVLGLGTELRHLGADGEQGWSLVPLQGEVGVAAAVVEIDVAGDAVLVGGDASGLAEVDLDDGTRRWYLPKDEARNFTGAGDVVRLLDGNLALVAGGAGGNKRLLLLDRSGAGEPSVVWSRDDTYTRVAVSEDGDLLVTFMESGLVALDMATGDEVWQAEDDGTVASVLAPPRIIRDEVVVVPRSGGPDGWDLQTGESVWRNEDREALFNWSASTDGHVRAPGDALDGQAVAMLDDNRVAVVDADGTLRAGSFHKGAIGTISALEVEGTLALITASSSSVDRPSNIWLVDLSDLG